jgi:hypothetical protein
MRSQVQVLAGPPTIPAGQSAAAPRPVAPTACLGRVGAARPPRSRAQGPLGAGHQRPSHGRPHAGDHGPDDLRAAMPQVGEPRRVPAPYRRAVPWQPAPPGRPGGRAWPLAEDLPTTTAKATPPLAQHGLRQLRASGSDSGRRPAGRGYRGGDHADSGRPRGVAARCIGALDELTRFGHRRRGNARIADADAQMPGRPTGHWTLDTGRLDAHTGHWTPVAWTSHAWTLDAGCC